MAGDVRQADFHTHPGRHVPLSFAPGEAYPFDWSYEIVMRCG
jgi:hypothetical protein